MRLSTITLSAFLAVFAWLTFGGCEHRVPTWSNATAGERARGWFRADAGYLASPEYLQSRTNSAEAIERLKP